MNNLGQAAVLGLGFLGGSISLAVLRCFSHAKVVGYTYRPSIHKTAGLLAMASERR